MQLNWDKIKIWLIVNIGAGLMYLWFSTCRVKIARRDLHDRYILSDVCGVGVTWHRGVPFLVWWFCRHIPLLIMASRSKDGEIGARFVQKFGGIPVRGSSRGGGREALQTMIEYFSKPGVWKAATPIDGPKGPRFVAKRGMIALAKETGTQILPIMISAYPAITLKKSWDKTIIPLPFSRVTITYREPWTVPKDISEQNFEQLRKEIEDTLNEMMIECDMDTGYGRQKGYDELYKTGSKSH